MQSRVTRQKSHLKKSTRKNTPLARNVIVGLILFSAIITAFIAVDYGMYVMARKSHLFGSKDSYLQKQPLYFDDIKVTVSEVEQFRTSPEAKSPTECAVKYPPKMERTHFDQFINQQTGLDTSTDINNGVRAICYHSVEEWKTKKYLVVHYFLENMQNKPISISDYSARIEGSGNIEGNNPNPKISNLLSRQSRYSNFVVRVPLDSNDFALVIAKKGHQKQIHLVLPKIKE